MQKESSYNPEYFGPLYRAEKEHFWFVSRNRLITSLINKVKNSHQQYVGHWKFLEIGCGTGNVLDAIAHNTMSENSQTGLFIGMDLFREGLSYTRKRGDIQTVQADIFNSPFHNSFQMVGLFDVLEHFEADRVILQQISQLLAPGGTLILTVPAFSCLWSYFDEEAHHARRYRIAGLEEKLKTAGFRINFVSYTMMCLFPFVWLTRRLNRIALSKKGGRNEEQANREKVESELQIIPLVNQLLIGLLGLETFLLANGIRLPFGTSVLAIARKE